MGLSLRPRPQNSMFSPQIFFMAMQLTLVELVDSFAPWNCIRRLSLSFVTGLPLNKAAEIMLLACDGPVDLFARDVRRQRLGR